MIQVIAEYGQGTTRFITLTPHKKFGRIRDLKATNIFTIISKSDFTLEIYDLCTGWGLSVVMRP